MNIDFLRRLAIDAAFIAANHTTSYVDGHLAELTRPGPITDEVLAIAALYRVLEYQRLSSQETESAPDPYSPWNCSQGFRVNQPDMVEVKFSSQDEMVTVYVYPAGDVYRLEVAGALMTTAAGVELHGAELRCRLAGRNVAATLVTDDEQVTIFFAGSTFQLLLPDPGRQGQESDVENSLRAPIPGKVTEMSVAAGDSVRCGDQLLVLEAMKMEYVIRAPADGKVITLLFQKGDSVREKDRLVEFQPLEGQDDAAA